MIATFKILNWYYDNDVCDFLCLHSGVVPNPDQVRGHTKTLFTRGPRLDVKIYSFGYRIVKPNFPEEVITAPTIKTFER